MAGDFAAIVRPLLEQRLAAGEALLGVIAATHQRTFSGELYAIGVTDRRLLLQPLDITTRLRTTDGEKLKLRALTGSGLIGGLAGGEGHREGVGALAQWTKRHL